MTLRGILAKNAQTATEDSAPEASGPSTKELVKVALIQFAARVVKEKTSGTRYAICRQVLQEPDYWVNRVYELSQLTHQLDRNSQDDTINQAVADTMELFFQD